MNIDIDKESFNIIVNAVKQNAPSKKYTKPLALPLFKIWLYDTLKYMILLDENIWWNLLNMNKPIMNQPKQSHIYLGQVIQEAINVFLEKDAFNLISKGRSGLNSLAGINEKWTIDSIINEIVAHRNFL